MPEKQTVQLTNTCAVVTCMIQPYDFWKAAIESQGICIYNEIKVTEVLEKFGFPLSPYTSFVVSGYTQTL